MSVVKAIVKNIKAGQGQSTTPPEQTLINESGETLTTESGQSILLEGE